MKKMLILVVLGLTVGCAQRTYIRVDLVREIGVNSTVTVVGEIPFRLSVITEETKNYRVVGLADSTYARVEHPDGTVIWGQTARIELFKGLYPCRIKIEAVRKGYEVFDLRIEDPTASIFIQHQFASK